jgi:hypothetical protein
MTEILYEISQVEEVYKDIHDAAKLYSMQHNAM